MIFDYDLMFIDDKDGTQKNVSTGVIGDTLDLVGAGQGKGYRSYIAIMFTSNTTAMQTNANDLTTVRNDIATVNSIGNSVISMNCLYFG